MLTTKQQDKNRLLLDGVNAIMAQKVKELLHRLDGTWDFIVVSGFRSPAEQKVIEANTAVVRAKAGWSFHNYGFAVDLGLLVGGKYIQDGQHPGYTTMGIVAEQLGFTWGGNWKGKKFDPCHIEWHPGETSKQAILRLREGSV